MTQQALVIADACPQFSSFTAMEYLQIDVAGTFGLDKESWTTRIEWTLQHKSHFEDVEEMGGDHSLVQSADEPAQFYASVCAYNKALKGEPTGHMISLDATASGIQILAALTGCHESAELCNLVNTGERVDAYTSLYEVMKEVNEGELTIEEEGMFLDFQEQLTNILPIHKKKTIQRSDFKQAIMTALYGSTRMPKKIFGKGPMLDIFYNVMRTCLPGAWNCNEVLKSLWQPYALSHDWVMPDNFHVHVKVMSGTQHMIQIGDTPVAVNLTENLGTEEGRSLSPNVTHSIDGMVVREMVRRCDYDMDHIYKVSGIILNDHKTAGKSTDRKKDKMLLNLWNQYKESGFLSARILDYIDIKNARLVEYSPVLDLLASLPTKPFKVISVHDCFRSHANYGNDLRKQYNIIMSGIARSDMLGYLATQITGTSTPVVKMGCIADDILNADYALS